MGETKSICVFETFLNIFSPENHPIIFLLRTINLEEVDQARLVLMMEKQKLKKRKSRKKRARLKKQKKQKKKIETPDPMEIDRFDKSETQSVISSCETITSDVFIPEEKSDITCAALPPRTRHPRRAHNISNPHKDLSYLISAGWVNTVLVFVYFQKIYDILKQPMK